MRLRGFALVAFLGGCGGSDGVSPAQAREHCNTFIESFYCPKLVTCFGGTLDQPTCVAAAQTGIDCTRVMGEKGDFATCTSQLDASPCTVVLDSAGTVHLPASCSGIFLIP